MIHKVKVYEHYMNTIQNLIQGGKIVKYWNKIGKLSAVRNKHIE